MILLRPVDRAFPVTQRFGENPAAYPGTRGHMGIDFGTPVGTRVVAAMGGKVVQAGLDLETANNPQAGYGIHVRITHPDGTQAVYGHLSACAAQIGQVVQTGEAIGTSGNTGRSTGPHLHFEIRSGASLTQFIDPEPFIVNEAPNALFSATITAAGDMLNVRSRPSTVGNMPLRQLRAGDTVQVIGFVSEAPIWLRLSDGTYILSKSGWQVFGPAS